MLANQPHKYLQIKKGQDWELWLIAPGTRAKLGEYKNLEELNRAQITFYRSWEGQPKPQLHTAEFGSLRS